MKRQLKHFDSIVTKAIIALFGVRSRSFFRVATFIGDPLFVLCGALLGAFYALVSGVPSLLLLSAAVPATLLVGTLLKLLFERARPETIYAKSMRMQTFSFPSGHSSGSTTFYGLLVFATMLSSELSLAIALLCTALAFIPVAVGLSRVYLGAHFPSDVVAGWLLGVAIISLVVAAYGAIV